MSFSIGKLLGLIGGVAVITAVVFGLMPQPLDVDLGAVTRGPMLVSVNEDGKTRIREKYTVSMPFPGRIDRILLDPGDSVAAGETVLVTITANSPDPLNERFQAEAEARVHSAELAIKRADAVLDKARSEQDWASTTYNRIRKLYEQNATTDERRVDAELLLAIRTKDVSAAEFAAEIARFELEQSKAALITAKPDQTVRSAADQVFEFRSPVTGKVLRVFHESAAPLATGTPLIEIGDPADLEMEIDVLSQDAVQIRKGAHVYIDRWGGDKTLVGTVRVVEPGGFTKISALGVEEQRVNVIADFTVPVADRITLGDGYRVDARIALWEQDNVLQVPASALFRSGDGWSVYVCDSGSKARRRPVQIGHRNAVAAEVISGLQENDTVVLHPADALNEGRVVRNRPASH